VTLGLVVLLWAAAAGPAALVDPSTRRPEPFRVRPSASPSPSATATPGAGRGVAHPTGSDLSWVGDALAWTVLLLLASGLVAAGVWAWRHRWHRPPTPATLEVEPLPDVRMLGQRLGRDAGARLAALGEGAPRDGIVGCWLHLEEAVAAAGVLRDPAETSSEFTVRVLRTLDLDPRAVADLAALYREARFSGHPMPESARTTARETLQRIHEDLESLVGRLDPVPPS
jgi:hypothetical protein